MKNFALNTQGKADKFGTLGKLDYIIQYLLKVDKFIYFAIMLVASEKSKSLLSLSINALKGRVRCGFMKSGMKVHSLYRMTGRSHCSKSGCIPADSVLSGNQMDLKSL